MNTMTDTTCTHICPICHGEAPDSLCPCEGRGIVAAAVAQSYAAHGLPIVPLPPLPTTAPAMPSPCDDCAFRAGSPERDDPAVWAALQQHVTAGEPFFCHQGMHLTARGRYVPRDETAQGVPVGHPRCAGWDRARKAMVR
jgi:hypothetical protein